MEQQPDRKIMGEIARRREKAEVLARRFHTIYETLAPEYGYRTRRASRKPWCDVPENNKALMIAVCEQILEQYECLYCEAEAECKELKNITKELSDQRMIDPECKS